MAAQLDRQARRADGRHRPGAVPQDVQGGAELAELVKAGKLPPVEERVGQDPLVVKPLHEIGKYGGTWRRGFTGPADDWNGIRMLTGPTTCCSGTTPATKVVPNIARGCEIQDGGKHVAPPPAPRHEVVATAQPFTADDFVFWFEDIYPNKELVPTPSASMAINGKPGVIEKVDDDDRPLQVPRPVLPASRRAGRLDRHRAARPASG